MLKRIGIMLAFALSAMAQDPMLAGLDGLSVNVTLKNSAVQGLQSSMFRSDIELRLRQYGIAIKSDAPTLSLEVLTTASGKSVVFSSILRLVQAVTLLRDPTMKGYGTTWSKNAYGVMPGNNASKELRDATMVMVDEFVAAYLRAKDGKDK